MIRPLGPLRPILCLSVALCGAGELRTGDSMPAPPVPGVIRINCGSDVPVQDEQGHVWEPDTKYFGTDPDQDGRTVHRGNIEITYTTIPSIYRTERYFFPPHGRNRFSCKLPNGRYCIRLHFAETHGVRRDMRKQTMEIEGVSYGPLDIVREAGGVRMALVKEVEIDVKDGELNIVFRQTGHDAALINGIEIVPRKGEGQPEEAK